MTEQIKRKLQEEMNVLEHELVHELPKEIKKAAALGDLSENAEYHMAKQRQEFVKARLRQLGARMAELALINMNNIPKDKVGLGLDGSGLRQLQERGSRVQAGDQRRVRRGCGQDLDQFADRPRPAEQESWRQRGRGHAQRQPRDGNPEPDHDPRPDGSQSDDGSR